MANKRMPKRVVLPFGYIVTVMMCSPGSEELFTDVGPVDGLWDSITRKIFINKALSARRRRRILLHELAHALNDCEHQLMDDGIIGD